MSESALESLIAARFAVAGVHLERGISELASFLRLLTKWNRSINLTALHLDPPTESAIDRLLVEPVVAAQFVHSSASVWFDLGSGGGSPAIPLKITRPELRLTMVEATVKKASFLREAVRALGISDATVEALRFEDLAATDRYRGRADLVTTRAVRTDAAFYRSARALLHEHGQLWIFRSTPSDDAPEGLFESEQTHQLIGSTCLQVWDACSTWNTESR